MPSTGKDEAAAVRVDEWGGRPLSWLRASAKMIASIAWRALKIFCLATLGLLALLVAGQRSLLYHPSNVPAETLERRASAAGMEPWLLDGERIGYKTASPPASGGISVLVLHGNAGSSADRAHYARILGDALPSKEVSVYILEYPDYGSRLGKPTEDSLVEAAERALNALPPANSVVLLGESLGTGVAARVAAGNSSSRIGGLVLITPFDRMARLAGIRFPILPAELLLFDKYDSASHIGNFGGRVAVVLAADDEVIPPVLGRDLYRACPGEKRLWVVEGAGHNDIVFVMGAARWAEVLAFASGKGGG